MHLKPMYLLEVWNQSEDIFDFIYPILCTLPYCWCIFFEKKDGYLKYIYTRTKERTYIMKMYFTGAILAALSIVIISVAGLLFTLYVFPTDNFQEIIGIENVFQTMQMEEPITFGLMLSGIRIIPAVLFYTLGFVLTYYMDNFFVAVSFPFIYSIFENFITDMIGFADCSIASFFNINRISIEYIRPYSMAVGPLLLVLIIIMTSYISNKKRGLQNV